MGIMKRLNAPDFWPVRKKEAKYVVSPSPGPHPKRSCIPLAMILRDYTGHARNMREAREILNSGIVKVDGATRKERNFPVGLMDIVSISSENYLVLPGKNGFYLQKTEADTKMSRIMRKLSSKNGKTQIGFHDGRNMLVSDANGMKTGDVAVVDFAKNEIRSILKMDKGSCIVVTSGKKAGHVGKIHEIIRTQSSQENKVIVDFKDSKVIIPASYAFVIGKDKPLVHIGE